MPRLPRFSLLAGSAMMLSACASIGQPTDRSLDAIGLTATQNFALAPDVAQQDRSQIDALLPSGDPGFERLREASLADAPTLAAALARIDLARAQAARANANRKPNISGDASVTRQRINTATFGGNLPPGVDVDRYITTYGANILASWDPDIFGQLRASERAAIIRIDAAEADAQGVRQSLTAAIGANVIDWRTLLARKATLESDRTAAKGLLDVTQTRSKAGISPGLDAVQAETLLAQAEAQLAPLDAERARIIGSLVTLTGQPTDTVIAALAEVRPAFDPASDFVTTPATMLRARPDIAAAEARLKAADADVAAAAAQRFPKLTLSGALGLISLALGDLFTNDAIVGTLGAGIAGPIFDFGRIEAEIDASKAGSKEAFANYRGAVFTALGDAEAAYGQVDAARREVLLLEQQEALEKDSVNLSSIRYRRGLSDFRAVLNAQRQLNAVRSSTDLARGRLHRARIALWLALGGSS
ncbi:TolC family protein [Parasphingorhabdus litoris]|uniref:TolC family protein n=1 Tax=Parasphingorhabdus litoris TaxID=394733 RepID=A0ABP3KBX4_9SPHN|nr:TolC family protein [Parasphingorhabdus litoris]